jgi:hypothetical protein
MGPATELIGTQLSSLPSRDSTGTFQLFDAARYRNVDPNGMRLPAYVAGALFDVPESRFGRCEVAVAVNGVVRGTGRCTDRAIRDLRAGAEPAVRGSDDGAEYFTVRVAPGSFRAGENQVSVHLLVSGDDGNPVSLVDVRAVGVVGE